MSDVARADVAAYSNRKSAFSRDSRYDAREGAAPVQSGALSFASFNAPPPPPAQAAETAPIAPPPRAPDLVEEARAQGYARGHADGRAEAEHEALERDAIRARFAFGFERINAQSAEQLRQRLMATVVALCEATLAPMALDKEALARRVTRAVAMFARADDERVIRLNPQDMDAVKDLLPADWTFVPDDKLEPGALRVETSSRGIDGGGVEDGPLQWRQAIAEALDLGAADEEC
ncbi:MAG: flagellar biosynthesis protein [Sphingomonadales bacterium]|nr:flagellar biosynthesis protein [Sphingomonadales bacterium]MDE2168879.1 flagellar biosynthesis protein [Sphingomonadales bacterium]